MFALANGQDRAGCATHDVLGGAAEQDVLQTCTPVSGNDDQVRLPFRSSPARQALAGWVAPQTLSHGRLARLDTEMKLKATADSGSRELP